MNRKKSWINILQTTLTIGAMAVILLPIFLCEIPWPTAARDYLVQHGQDESGATNLVSAIYLGYRAFDTLGETIVLLVAVIGTMGLLSRVESLINTIDDDVNTIQDVSAFTLNSEKRRSHLLRTHLLEVVTGTIGPIVLLFGFYVMLYGHLSPGGGFQGGVIIASGIIFLALGNQQDKASALSKSSTLGGIETVSFLLLLLVAISGIFFGKGFFGNPLEESAYPVGYIILMNSIIGMKVGASIGAMCIVMMGGHTR